MPQAPYVAIQEILDVVLSTDRESHSRELKRYRLLRSGEANRLAKAIVALSNLAGGELLIGINDDGTLDGEKAEPDVDRGRLERICEKISPRPQLFPYFVTSSSGDVMVVPIPPRSTVPLALVKKNGAGNIVSREYWVRDSHGVSVATDALLAQMFGDNRVRVINERFAIALTHDLRTGTLIRPTSDLFQHESFGPAMGWPPQTELLTEDSSDSQLDVSDERINEIEASLLQYAPIACAATFLRRGTTMFMIGGPRRHFPVIPEQLKPCALEKEHVAEERTWDMLQRYLRMSVSPLLGFLVPSDSTLRISYENNGSVLELDFAQGKLVFETRLASFRSGIPPSFRTMMLDRRSGPLFTEVDSPFFTFSFLLAIRFVPRTGESALDELISACSWASAIGEWVSDVWDLGSYTERYPMLRISDMERKIDHILDIVSSAYKLDAKQSD